MQAHSDKRRGRRQSRGYRLVDPAAVAAELRRIVEPYRNVLTAAGKIGIKQPTLWRLLNGQVRTITAETWAAIEQATPPARRAALTAAIVEPAAQRIVGAYVEWLDTWKSRVFKDAASRWVWKDQSLTRVPDHEAPARRNAERDALMKVHQAELAALDAWVADALAAGHSEDRVQLAIARILEPLLEAPASGYVERSWQEMSITELRQFIRAGVTRERLLLRRAPDVERAQEIAAPTSETLRRFPFWRAVG